VKVDPGHFLLQLQAAYELPITNLHGVHAVEIGVLDDVAERIVRGGMKLAAAEHRPGFKHPGRHHLAYYSKAEPLVRF